jgi:hypothetical protein
MGPLPRNGFVRRIDEVDGSRKAAFEEIAAHDVAQRTLGVTRADQGK